MAKIDWCCDDLEEMFEDSFVSLNEDKDGFVLNSAMYEYKIKFCPMCGTELEELLY